MDDLSLQADEIEALSAIYADDWKTESVNDRSYSYKLTEGIYEVTIYLTLPLDYPTQSPPSVQLSAPNLSRMNKQQIALELDDLYLENIGQSVIYQLIEKIREYLQGILKGTETEEMKKRKENKKNETKNKTEEKQPQKEIQHGSIIKDRKSVFQGHLAQVHSMQDIKEVMDCLLENRKVAEATHNISAYRIQQPEKGNVLQDYDDDGETQAGKRLLHLLEILDVTNVLVIVSRWFGGIQLGPDRFRHINNAGRQVLEQAGYIEGKK